MMDSSMFKREPDSFVTLSLGAQVAKTETVPRSRDPTWN